MDNKILIKNRKAEHDFEFEYKVEAGIVLRGDEVKSIRKSTPSIRESYAYIDKMEVFLKNLSLSHAASKNRLKKLLLHKNEINKILGWLSKGKYTLIPMELHERKKFKVVLGVGRRLKEVDKREKLKKRDLDRSMRNEILD